MTGQQQLVAGAGAALIGAVFWTGPQRSAFTAGALSSSASPAQQQAAHAAVKQLAGELLFVLVAAALAGLSRTAGNAMLAIVGALFLVWGITHYAGGTSTGQTTRTPAA